MAVLGSLLVPGWGHYALGRTWRGVTWLVISTLALLAGMVAGALWCWLALLLRPAAALEVAVGQRGSSTPSAGRSMLALLVGLVVATPAGPADFVYGRYLVELLRVSGGSMIPTLQVGDRVLVRKRPLMARAPTRGDVILFRFPLQERRQVFKRVIGVPGDTVGISDDMVFVNGVALPRQTVPDPCEYLDRDEASGRWEHRRCHAWREAVGDHHYTVIQDERGEARFSPAVVVPPDSYFVLGDNRDNSNDSRAWGFVKLDQVLGIARDIWFPSAGPAGAVGGLHLGRIGARVQ